MAVQLDLATWRALVALLEDLEDAAELKQARQEDDILVDWEEVVAGYSSAHPELNSTEADVWNTLSGKSRETNVYRRR
jgi:hypothetical protein